MSSILRKAMWPAALVIGMFVLIGAIGTATAPTAFADDGDMCSILGPFPPHIDGSEKIGTPFLLEGKTYLFALAVEGIGLSVEGDPDDEHFLNVSIDDEDGDADIESYATSDGDGTDGTFVDLPGSGVDNIDLIPNWPAAGWSTAFLDDLDDDWDSSYPVVTDFEFGDIDGDPCQADAAGAAIGWSFITVTCDEDGEFEITIWEDANTANSLTNDYICVNAPSAITLTATPGSVESAPAPGNVSHSLIVATVTDAAGNFVGEGYDVDWTTDKCLIGNGGIGEVEYEAIVKGLFSAFKSSIPSTAASIELYFSGHSGASAAETSKTFLHDNSPAPGHQSVTLAAAVLHCEGVDPGTATVTAEIEDSTFGPSSDISASTTVTVVGPPQFITMTAAPTELVCGEKATILVTITDAINQNVSDHTRVELITNYGGVIGGTGSSLGFPGVNPVNPLSSSAGETFGGVATAYLLTSTNHIGAYEVVAAAGGSNLGSYSYTGSVPFFFEGAEGIEVGFESVEYFGQTGQFSTPVVTSQVTVTCTEGAAPDVTAPDTGTGSISPPNTGDAGLAASSAGTASLFVIFGAVAFVLAGFASFGFARR